MKKLLTILAMLLVLAACTSAQSSVPIITINYADKLSLWEHLSAIGAMRGIPLLPPPDEAEEVCRQLGSTGAVAISPLQHRVICVPTRKATEEEAKGYCRARNLGFLRHDPQTSTITCLASQGQGI